MSWRSYIGPYFECARRPVEKKTTRRVCSSVNCMAHAQSARAGDAFCFRCGAANVTEEFSVTHFARLRELVHEQLQEMHEDGAVVCMGPNVRRDGFPERPDLDEDEKEKLDIGVLNLNAECTWLDEAFAAERAMLEAKCVSVETKWGFQRWYL